MKTKHFVLLLFGLFFTVIVLRLLWICGELYLKSDNAHIATNLYRVDERLKQYHTEHGAYPPQQDMKSLLNTLGMSKSDFEKTRFFDISSAEYHAPSLNPEDSAQNMDDPVLSIRVKSSVFGKYERFYVRKDGLVGRDYNIETKP